MAQKFLSIKNFEKYQHYKHRNPPWIKLHLELLDDVDFLRMPDASKWHYVGLLLLASRHENSIQADRDYIKNRLGLTTDLDVNARFIRGHVLASKASKTLPTKLVLGGSETEAEKSREETEGETAQAPPSPTVVPLTKEKKRPGPLPEDFKFSPELRDWALAKGCKEPFAEFERFCTKAVSKGWVYNDWSKAYQNWVLNELKWAREKNHAAV